jgi:hypothetical protein
MPVLLQTARPVVCPSVCLPRAGRAARPPPPGVGLRGAPPRSVARGHQAVAVHPVLVVRAAAVAGPAPRPLQAGCAPARLLGLACCAHDAASGVPCTCRVRGLRGGGLRACRVQGRGHLADAELEDPVWCATVLLAARHAHAHVRSSECKAGGLSACRLSASSARPQTCIHICGHFSHQPGAFAVRQA